MEKSNALSILEALANGCHPFTGELLEQESVFNDRMVIRAIQYAIDQINFNISVTNDIEVPAADLDQGIELLKSTIGSVSVRKLSSLLLGNRKFKISAITDNPLYGKYKNKYQVGIFTDYVTQYLSNKGEIFSINNQQIKHHPIFDLEVFNKLSLKAIDQLKTKIKAIELKRTSNLSEVVLKGRINHYRYSEPWSSFEEELLLKSLEYTNDMDVLSNCFGRTPSTLIKLGTKLLIIKEKESRKKIG
jgi:hypothetical protein